MPPRKRVASAALADDTGTVEARIRRHLASMAASQAAILSLLDQLASPPPPPPPVDDPSSRGIIVPDDIVRHIFQFVTGQRRCAQFGVDRVLLRPARFKYPLKTSSLRLINKQWARIGGEFVRWLVTPRTINCTPAALVRAFPHISRLSLWRCILDCKTLGAFAAVMKAFSHRPVDSFYADIKFCSTIGKLTFDCRGKVVEYSPFFHCQVTHDTLWNSDNLMLLNRACGDLEVSQYGPDEIMVTAYASKQLHLALSQPMKVRTFIVYFDDAPPFAAWFRASVLRIEICDPSETSIGLDKWLAPSLWVHGRRPPIKLVGEKRIHNHLIDFAQRLAERHQISVSVVTDD